ncbi:ADP-ribosylglycohydrolase family protein [Jiangella asiatica]|uniref:ADP-ribosylglycohydrolase family protein n=1 Tax=Jiangella asiatica TaxID=2530372 RepID=A0A4R5DFW4_9ACTN|nr:ADP-ribosylglycohydrolase family protein [Jiangella asiatica]TDE10684.1 ADP-ribosylglycohydrolase family protein [Jiangella asiatica]
MLPADYEERVYAGVLGKVIAVYLGRPFEGWRYDRIMAELGEVTHFVNDRHDVALKHHLLVVPDDDISGTLVFPRALRHHGLDPSPAQVGLTWLNELIENKTVLWWGGLGNSTEHTAYLRLREGLVPPESGSIARNGTVVAEQVGAQIFVEGFAMTCPSDPEGAADLAERAARVSHDGEAIHAARVVAALVAQAFVEPDMGKLLDIATDVIPADCLIRRVIDDVRGWQAGDGDDWHRTRARIDERYGYHRYGGNCHVVPNHATVINALASSDGDFSRAMTVVATSGWDTDSNAGNVGAITGVRGGLAGLGPRWRDPVADRLYLPSADGGAAVTDAGREALVLVGHGRARYGEPPLDPPKDGARFHFTLPGSVQGFTADDDAVHVGGDGDRLTVRWTGDAARPVSVTSPVFIPPEAAGTQIYGLRATPALVPGQVVTARVTADDAVTARLLVRHYDGADELGALTGPPVPLGPSESAELSWRLPDLGGQPVAAVGLELDGAAAGTVHLDRLGWSGEPHLTLTRPVDGGTMWRRAWVDAVDRFDDRWPEPFRLAQNRGTGLVAHGGRDWRDYTVTADVTPHLADAAGIAARYQGLERYYALELAGGGTVRLVRRLHGTTVLTEAPFAWSFGTTYRLTLAVAGSQLRAAVGGGPHLRADDPTPALDSGGIALLVTGGRTATTAVHVRPHSERTPR